MLTSTNGGLLMTGAHARSTQSAPSKVEFVHAVSRPGNSGKGVNGPAIGWGRGLSHATVTHLPCTYRVR